MNNIIIGGFSEDFDNYDSYQNYDDSVVTAGADKSSENTILDQIHQELNITPATEQAWVYTKQHAAALDRLLGATNYYMTCRICETNNTPPATSAELAAMFPHINYPHDKLLDYLNTRTGLYKKVLSAKVQLIDTIKKIADTQPTQKLSNSDELIADVISTMGILSQGLIAPSPPTIKLQFEIPPDIIAANNYAEVCRKEAELCAVYKQYELYYYKLVIYLYMLKICVLNEK